MVLSKLFRWSRGSEIPFPSHGSDSDRVSELRKICAWPSNYPLIDQLVSLANGQRVLEIGVAYGYHADHLLSNFPGLEYVGVDPFEPSYDPNDGFSEDVARLFGTDRRDAMDRLYEVVKTNLQSNFADRSSMFRQRSSDFLKELPRESFDFIYIDGDHREQAVLADIEESFRILRPGGVLCGDDLDWPGVLSAVKHFERSHAITTLAVGRIGQRTTTWFVQKAR